MQAGYRKAGPRACIEAFSDATSQLSQACSTTVRHTQYSILVPSLRSHSPVNCTVYGMHGVEHHLGLALHDVMGGIVDNNHDDDDDDDDAKRRLFFFVKVMVFLPFS